MTEMTPERIEFAGRLSRLWSSLQDYGWEGGATALEIYERYLPQVDALAATISATAFLIPVISTGLSVPVIVIAPADKLQAFVCFPDGRIGFCNSPLIVQRLVETARELQPEHRLGRGRNGEEHWVDIQEDLWSLVQLYPIDAGQ